MTLRMPLKSLLVLGLLASASVLAADTAKAPAAPVPLVWKVSDKDNAVKATALLPNAEVPVAEQGGCWATGHQAASAKPDGKDTT